MLEPTAVATKATWRPLSSHLRSHFSRPRSSQLYRHGSNVGAASLSSLRRQLWRQSRSPIWRSHVFRSHFGATWEPIWCTLLGQLRHLLPCNLCSPVGSPLTQWRCHLWSPLWSPNLWRDLSRTILTHFKPTCEPSSRRLGSPAWPLSRRL